MRIKHINLLKILYSFFFITVIMGCYEKTSKLEFQNNKNLTGEILQLNYEFKRPQQFRIIDSILVACDDVDNKTVIVINMNSKDYFSIGTKGEGPGELLSAWTIDFDKLKKNIWIYDIHKNKYNIFNIDSINKNHDWKPQQITINTKNDMPSYMQIIDSLKFLSTGIYNDGIFALYTIADSMSKTFGKAPEINKITNSAVLNELYSYILTYNKFEKKVAICSQSVDQLLIYDSLYKKQCDITTSGGIVPDFGASEKEFKGYTLKSVVSYNQIYSTKKYIYASFYGKNRIELNKDGFHLNTVHVFDWDGNPLFKYTLDRKIISFTIDEKDNYLYGISYEKETPELLKFKL